MKIWSTALFMCEALTAVGARRHIVIDPDQFERTGHRSRWKWGSDTAFLPSRAQSDSSFRI